MKARDKKALIVRYTQSAGNTERVTRQFQKTISGDLGVASAGHTPYEGFYGALLKQTAKEIKTG